MFVAIRPYNAVKIISIRVISWISHHTSVQHYEIRIKAMCLCSTVQCTLWLYILLFINEIIVYNIVNSNIHIFYTHSNNITYF